MDEQEHKHTSETWSENQKIVCQDCATQTGGDECFCRCHIAGFLTCSKCKTYHNKLHKGYDTD